jgi:hypothetical protein
LNKFFACVHFRNGTTPPIPYFTTALLMVIDHTDTLIIPKMAKSEHLTIIERVAQLCFAVNLRIQAEFSQFQLEEVELRDDGSLELIRAFHQGESALEEFDEAQMLKDFEEKHRNAALMYRHCTFSVMFFGRFVEEVLKGMFE